MEKLSIKQASEQFGLSRARLYQLLDKGAVAGYRTSKKEKGGTSWIDSRSLNDHLKNKDNKKGGRPKTEGFGDYLPVKLAAEKIGYSTQHINRLIRLGSIIAKPKEGVSLVYYPSLLQHKNK